MQGFNMQGADCEGITDSNLADLAGNVFCGAVVTAILSSTFISIPWTSEEEMQAQASKRDALAEVKFDLHVNALQCRFASRVLKSRRWGRTQG